MPFSVSVERNIKWSAICLAKLQAAMRRISCRNWKKEKLFLQAREAGRGDD
jgi:hypothetical protein